MPTDENEKKPKEKDSSDDVLKKLQSVRRRLQESLSEGEEKVAKKPASDISLVPGAAETLRKVQREKRAEEQKKRIEELDKAAAAPAGAGKKKKRALYKKGAEPDTLAGVQAGLPTTVAPKKVKKGKVKRVSQRQMAAIQRRVQEKVKATKRMSKKRRAVIVATIVLCAMPLALTNQIAVATMNFDLDNIALEYQGRPGELLIYLPTYNPGILPAYLGKVELEIWDTNHETGEPFMVGQAQTDAPLWIQPHQTVQLSLRLTLDVGHASSWMANLLNTLSLQLNIREFHYNGIKIADNLIPPIPAIDIQSLILDMLGVDMTSLITDLFPTSGEEQLQAAYQRALGLKPDSSVKRDLWLEYLAALQVKDAKDKLLLDEVGQNPSLTDPLNSELGRIMKFAIKSSIKKSNLGFPSSAIDDIKPPNAAQSSDSSDSSSMTDLFSDLELKDLVINDFPEYFQVSIVMGIPLPDAGDLIGFHIGNVVITHMLATMYLTRNAEKWNYASDLMSNDSKAFEDTKPEVWEGIYDYPFITLETIPSDYVGEAHKDLYGDVLNEQIYPNMSLPDGMSLEFGGMAKMGLNITIMKDDIGNADIHPSQQVNWDDPLEKQEFIDEAKTKYPAWYFIYDLLMNGALNVYLQVNDLDATIFGIPIEDTKVLFLPPITGTGLFDLTDLGSNIGFGMFDAVKLLVLSGATGGAMFPAVLDDVLPGKPVLNGKRNKGPRAAELDYDEDIMTQIEDMLILDIDTDEILDSLVETFDDEAKLQVTLTIQLNNTLFDIWVGLKDTWIGLSDTIDGEEKVFAKLDLSQEGSKEVFLEGMLQPGDEPYPLTISLTLYKNETMAKYAEPFLRKIIEDFTLDSTFNLHIGQLLLFKEKYTWPDIDIAMGFELDLWSMLEDSLVSMMEDLFNSTTSEETTTSAGSGLLATPFGLPIGTAFSLAFGNPVAGLLGVPAPAQTSDESSEESEDPLSQMLSDLLGVDMGNLEVSLSVDNLPTSTQISLDVTGLEVSPEDIPIHVGMGYADIDIFTKKPPGPGQTWADSGWERIMNVKINNYLELPSPYPQSIRATLNIYHSETLCAFTEGLLNGGTLNISMSGKMDLNLTGIYIDDAQLDLTGERTLEDIEMGVDIQSLVDDMISGLDAGNPWAGLYPGEFPSWWTGDPADFVRGAQMDLTSFDEYLEMGDFYIYKIEEDNWPVVTNDTDIHIQLGVEITNHLMTMEIKDLNAELYVQDDSTLNPPVYITSPNPDSKVGGDGPENKENTNVVTSPVDDACGVRHYTGGVPGSWQIDPLREYRQQEMLITGSNPMVDGDEYGAFTRFSVDLPQASTITKALLNITPTTDLSLSGANQFRVWGFDDDDIGDFRDGTYMNKPLTTASVMFTVNPGEWQAGVPIQVDVKSIVSEIVSRPYFNGTHVGFLIEWVSGDDDTPFTVYQYDSFETNPSHFPRLLLNYTTPDPGTVVNWQTSNEYVKTKMYVNGTLAHEDTGSGSYKIPDSVFDIAGAGTQTILMMAYDGLDRYLGQDAISVDYQPAETPVAGTARPPLTARQDLLGRITLEEGTGVLPSDYPQTLIINIDLNKSYALQNWLNTLLDTLSVTGVMDANLTLGVFNCQIGPLYINDLDLGALGLSADSLLDAVNPLSQKFGDPGDVVRGAPSPAQADLMDAIGKFGLGWLVIKQCQPEVKPIDPDNPMIDVIVGVALQPTLNLTLEGGSLQLLDKTIFDAVYNKDPEETRDWDLWNQAVTLSRIAEVSFRQKKVFMNNTYNTPSRPNNFTVDPWKPYFYNYTTTDFPDDGYTQMETFIQDYYASRDDLRGDGSGHGILGYNPDRLVTLSNESYIDNATGKPAYVDGTFSWFEIELRMYNMSHPDFQYAYPRNLWRQMGAPFFPIQVFGPDQGGFPDHRVEYHKYFSPFSNFFGSIGSALTDPAALLSNVAFNGSMKMNVFSLDLELDVGTPAISSLMGSLTTMLGESLADTIDQGANPARMLGLPTVQAAGHRVLRQVRPGLYVPRSSQFDDLFGGSMEFDTDSLYALRDAVLASERNGHAYFADYEGNSYGGTNYNPFRTPNYDGRLKSFVDSPDPGKTYNEETFYKDQFYEAYKIVVDNWAKSPDINEQNPFFETQDPIYGTPYEDSRQWPLAWKGNPSFGHRLRTTVLYYVLGLDMPFTIQILSAFAPLYAWHSSKPCTYAPMGYAWINESRTIPQGSFPDVYTHTGIPDPNHWMGTVDEDATSWREGKEPFIFYQNEAQRKALIDQQSDPLREQDMYAWDPYTWVHAPTGHHYYDPNRPANTNDGGVGIPTTKNPATDPSAQIPDWTKTSPSHWTLGHMSDRFINGTAPYWSSTYESTSTGGHVYQPSNWLDLNLRLFESHQAWEFLWELISNDLALVIPLIGFQANVSMFGYHIYDLALELPLESEMVHFAGFCESSKTQGGGGSALGVPAANGTVNYEEDPEEEWPPSLPGFKADVEKPDIFSYIVGEDFLDIIDLDGLIDQLISMLIDAILHPWELLDWFYWDANGDIHLAPPPLDLTIYNPIPLPIWLWKLKLAASMTNNASAAAAADEGGDEWDLIVEHADTWISWTDKAAQIWAPEINIEFDNYPDKAKFDPGNPWPWNEQIPGGFDENGVPNGDFMVDPMEMVDLRETGEAITVAHVYVDINLGIIGDLFGGTDNLLIWIRTFDIFAGLPREWDWNYRLTFSDISEPMTLGGLSL
ncbi:MAG: hypothetical protein ACTSU5_13430 [Promethearchaeota archaeon]